MAKKWTAADREIPSWVCLPDGSKKLFPGVTEICEREDSGIDLWDEQIYRDGFAKGEYTAFWLNPACKVIPPEPPKRKRRRHPPDRRLNRRR